ARGALIRRGRDGRAAPVRECDPQERHRSPGLTEEVMRLFELRDISRNFGAIQALTKVNLKIDAGEVLGLMGDNGAGNSTLIKIMAGNFPPPAGEIWLKGAKVEFNNPVDARR